MSPPVVPGKISRHWYVDAHVARVLRLRCAEENRKESHVVTEAIQALLEMTRGKTLRGENL